jgi:FdrA protein
VVVIGTDDDPQGRADQITRLEAAGARVFTRLSAALEVVVARTVSSPEVAPIVGPTAGQLSITQPQVINVGLESFYQSFVEQGVAAVHVAWRPPAGGDARLVALLDALRAEPMECVS